MHRKTKQTKCHSRTQIIIKNIEYGLFLRLLQFGELSIALGVLNQLSKAQFGEVLGSISTAVAILTVIALRGWEVALIVFMYKSRIYLSSDLYETNTGAYTINTNWLGKQSTRTHFCWQKDCNMLCSVAEFIHALPSLYCW